MLPADGPRECCRRCREDLAFGAELPDAVCIPWGRYFPTEARMPLCDDCAYRLLGTSWSDGHTRDQSAIYVLPTEAARPVEDRDVTDEMALLRGTRDVLRDAYDVSFAGDEAWETLPLAGRILDTLTDLDVALAAAPSRGTEGGLGGGCPVLVWDGPYRYRCGLGGDGNVCARHGRFGDAAPSDGQEGSDAH
jgi:hypothetical protein